MKSLVAALAVVLSVVVDQAWAQSPPMATGQERAILLELFEATGGPRWKQSGKWAMSSDPCEWHGVGCLPIQEDGRQRMAPGWITLPDNNLTGAIPRSILQLPHLNRLYLPGNKITSVHEEVFARADSGRLELVLAGNPIPELLVRVEIRIESHTGMCMPDQLVLFSADLDAASHRGHYEAFFCAEKSRNRPYCLVGEPYAGGFDLVSRALQRIAWKREGQSHHEGALSDHEEMFDATLFWGDGRRQKLQIHGGRGPIDAQIAYQLLKSLIHPEWIVKARRVKCDTLAIARH
jgi:hypothetical protein